MKHMELKINFSLFSIISVNLLVCFILNRCNAIEWTQKLRTSWSNRTIYEFHDIEYGVHFKDHRKFLASFERDSFKNSIDQGDEDENVLSSLKLTIATTKLRAKQPVMVHIGGYDLQSSGYGGASSGFLLEKDIVLVSVDFRVGPIGFLSMRNSKIPGNAAFCDILLALKWIQDNIAKYGGDPDRVTLFGQYKAAGLIHALTFSDLAQNAFHQVILQSGSALLKNFSTKHPVKYCREVGISLNCSDVIDKLKLTECLVNAKSEDLATAYKHVWRHHKGNIPFITIGGPSNILNTDPDIMQRSGKFRSYPKIIGFVDQPSASFFDYFDRSNDVPSFFSMERFTTDAIGMIQSAGELFGKTPLDGLLPNASSLANLKNADEKTLKQTFNLVLTSILDWSNFYVKSAVYYSGFLNKQPKTYAYAFKYTGEHHTLFNNEHLNAVIMKDDDQYLFDQWYKLNAIDTKLAKTIVDLWTSFAETGRPLSSGITQWPEVKAGADDYLIIDEEIATGKEYTSEFQSAVQTYVLDADDLLLKKFVYN